MLAAVNKAKQKGATALLEISEQEAFIFDPIYDLTQEVIEDLNKTYVPSIALQLNPQDMLHKDFQIFCFPINRGVL